MVATQIIAIMFTAVLVGLILIDVVKREPVSETSFFSKEQTDWLRGIAILLVIHSHYFAAVDMNCFSGISRQLLSSIGFLGVGLFVFMSGYATMISYIRKPNYLSHYIPKRLVRLYIPFLIAYTVFVIIMLCYGKKLSTEDFLGIPIMSLPHTINWYLKVQLGLYIVFYFVAKIFKNIRIIILALSLICVAFMIVGAITKIPNFWFESSFLFPLGMIFALNKNKYFNYFCKHQVICSLSSSLVMLLTYILYYLRGGLLFEIVFTFGFVQFFVALCFYFKGRSVILKFLGVLSIDLYLSHIVYSNTIMTYYNADGSLLAYFLFVLFSLLIGVGIHYLTKIIIGFFKKKMIAIK